MKQTERLNTSSIAQLAIVFATCCYLLNGESTRAQSGGDIVELIASGGRLAGRIDGDARAALASRSGQLTMEMESGGRIALEIGSTARVVQANQAAVDAYEEFSRALSDTTEDHWRAVDWCLAQPSGKIVYERFLRMHLLRIVDLDVNDRKAAAMLNGLPQPIQLVQRNNNWIDERLLMAAHGYRYNRKWGSHLQSAISSEYRARDQAKKEFLSAYRRWEQRAKNLDRMTASRALEDLMREHGSAVVFLIDLAKNEKLAEKRLVMVEAIGTSTSAVAGNALIMFAIEDSEPQIRDRAQSLLLQPHYNRVALADKARAYLVHKNNEIVRRAGALLGELDAFNSVLPLINALVTRHSIPNPLAQPSGQMNFGVNNQGGLGFQPGGNGQPKEITRDIENPSVLSALRKITQPLSPPDMGFDESRWSAWYAQIMSSGKDLRRDD